MKEKCEIRVATRSSRLAANRDFNFARGALNELRNLPALERHYDFAMPAKRKTLMRSFGEFFGHIAKGFTAPVKPAQSESKVVRQEVQERSIDTPEGPITLRRTTIDEVEIPKPPDT